MTRHYAVYGATLASTMELPELREVPEADARWHFGTTARLPGMRDATELGADRIYDAVHARLFAHAEGHRITVDDTGRFDIARDGRRILWEERAESWPDFVRAHLVGRVLATAMYLDGWLPLHASAVALGDGVVAFLAPKGFGKSTLALALVHAGARLVTDDTLPIEPGDAPRAWPGVHSVRLRDDALLAVGAPTPSRETREGKRVVADLAAESLLDRPAPLRAVYLLAPGHEGVSRAALGTTHAAVGIVGHTKIGRMLGTEAAPVMLARAAAVARRVPVHQLQLPRDLDRLGETTRALLDWHGGAT